MNSSLWQLAAWTMIHSLWIGAAVALVGGTLRVACRRAGPNTRYAVCLATLTALAITPIAAAAWLGMNGVPAIESVLLPPPGGEGWGGGQQLVHAPNHPSLSLPIEGREPEETFNRNAVPAVSTIIDLAHANPAELAALAAAPQPTTAAAIPLPPRQSQVTSHQSLPPTYSPTHLLTSALPHLPTLWLIGAPLTFLLLAAGLIGSERLRRRATPILAGHAHDACERLRQTLRISRRVALAACDEIAQPILVGIVRPLILLPTAALAGWTPDELDMVLLHELAHVRRWDNLVNLLQRIVESALFFHPAVWLVSRQVRRDREECCDAAVVARIPEPTRYAELLVTIAAHSRSRLSGATPSLAVASAMASHPLAGRIRRILNLEEEPMRITRRTLAATLLLPLLLAGAIFYSGANAENAQTVPPTQGEAKEGISNSEQTAGPSSPIEVNALLGSNSNELPLIERPDPLTQALADLESRKQAVLAAQAALEKVREKTTFTQDELIEKSVALQWKNADDHQLLTEQQAAINALLQSRTKAGAAEYDAAVGQLKKSLGEVEQEIAARVAAIKANVTEQVTTADSTGLDSIRRAIVNEDIGLAKDALSRAHNEFNTARTHLIQLPPTAPTSPIQGAAAAVGRSEEPQFGSNSVDATKELTVQFPQGFPDSESERERIRQGFEADGFRALAQALELNGQGIHFIRVTVPAHWNAKPVWESHAIGNAISMVCRIVDYPAATSPPLTSSNQFSPIHVSPSPYESSAWNLSEQSDNRPGSFETVQEFAADAAMQDIQTVVDKLTAEGRKVGIESHVDGRKRIVDLTKPTKPQEAIGSSPNHAASAISGMPAKTPAVNAQTPLPARFQGMKKLIVNLTPDLITSREDLNRILKDLKASGFKATRGYVSSAGNSTDTVSAISVYVPVDWQAKPVWGTRADANGAQQKTLRIINESETTVPRPTEAELQAAFRVSADNPNRTVMYDAVGLPTDYDNQWEDAFEGLQLDPYGPQYKFEFESRRNGEEFKITAPVAAHRLFFMPFFSDSILREIRAAAAKATPVAPPTVQADAPPTFQEGLPGATRELNTFRSDANLRLLNERTARQQRPSAIETTQAILLADRALLELDLYLKQQGALKNPSPSQLAALKATRTDLETIRAGLEDERQATPTTASTANTSAPPSKFPTFEQQQIADRAWRLFGVDFEPLQPAELERVKKLGYAGGVRVGKNEGGGSNLPPDDLLVGLHAWPVTSMESLGAILDRDGLGDLAPLKFYVIRNPERDGDGAADPAKDKVITGRLKFLNGALNELREEWLRRQSGPPPISDAPAPTPTTLPNGPAPAENGLATIKVVQAPVWSINGPTKNHSQTTAYLKIPFSHPSNPFGKAGSRPTAQEIERRAMNYIAFVHSPDILAAALSAAEPQDVAVDRNSHEVELLRRRLTATFPGDGEIMELKLTGGQENEDPALLQAFIDAYINAMAPPANSRSRLSAPPPQSATPRFAPPSEVKQRFESRQYVSVSFLPTTEAESLGPAETERIYADVLKLAKSPEVLQRAISEPLLSSSPLASAPDKFEKLLATNLRVTYPNDGDTMEFVLVGPFTKEVLETIVRAFEQVAVEKNPQVRIGVHDQNYAPYISDPRQGVQKTTFLYDGKTFEQWRDLWKLELKPERRAESMNALAAFGRAGRGQDAVTAILEVASASDLRAGAGEDQAFNFLHAAQNALSSLPLNDSLPLLIERLRQSEGVEREFFSELAKQVLGTAYSDPQSKPLLLEIANRPELGLEEMALVALIRRDNSLEDEDILALARQSLSGEAPSMRVLRQLGFQRLDKIPEQFELLFHPSPDVQAQARLALSQAMPALAEKDRNTIADRLLEALENPKREEDQVAAIRAISTSFQSFNRPDLAAQTDKLIGNLKVILEKGGDDLLLPAIVALSRLTASSEELVVRNAGVSDERAGLLRQLLPRVKEEQQQLSPGGSVEGQGGGFF